MPTTSQTSSSPHDLPGTTQYAYDAMGNMVETNENGVTTMSSIPSGSGNVVGHITPRAHSANYTYGSGLVSQTTGASTFYYTFDGTGNTEMTLHRRGRRHVPVRPLRGDAGKERNGQQPLPVCRGIWGDDGSERS